MQYRIADAALSAFGVFFSQTASFLAYQRQMKQSKGRSNAQSLFQAENIPSDPQIRNLLDPLDPSLLDGLYFAGLKLLAEAGKLKGFEVLEQQLLVSLDGTTYFRSQKIHCPNCQHRQLANDQTLYYHSAITPIVLSPHCKQVLSLPPEFIRPQDGHDKQDCEQAAGKRWLEKQVAHFQSGQVTLLGDDLYSRQPFCEQALELGYHFILVCKPDSHQILYEWLDYLEANGDVETLQERHFNGRFMEKRLYRFINHIPLRGGEEALILNWFEITITHAKTGKRLYYNSFVTDHPLHNDHIAAIAQAGRGRWKIENENNNVLKNHGYHLEHNFGHGKQFLASFLLCLNLLAFLFHTLLELMDQRYVTLRQVLGTRQTFFDDLRALTRYFYFDSFDHLLDFMLQQLDIPPYLDSG